MNKKMILACILLFGVFVRANPVLDPSALDTSIDPCQNFYQFSCGNWIKNTTLPSDQSKWARSFSVVYEQNLKTLDKVLSDYVKEDFTLATPYQEKLGDFYASCMDTKHIEKESFQVLVHEMGKINKLDKLKQLPSVLAKLHLQNTPAFFALIAAGDLKTPTLEIAEIDQGGFGLPDATFYTRTDSDAITLRNKYAVHIAKMFALAGYSGLASAAAATDVLAVETELARSALPPENLQDPTTLYHPGDVGALQKSTKLMDWTAYFKSLDIKTPQIINITEPKFMAALDSVLKNSDLSRIRTYLKWHVLESMAPTLGQALYTEWFNFNGKILNGQKEPAPRWKQCVGAVSDGMGEALGQAFVAKTFTPQAKEKTLKLIANLRLAFQQDLKLLMWLDSPTRAAALAKLDLISQKIGYPDNWRNYDKLSISKSGFWKNVIRSNIFESQRELNKIGGKVDPAEWGMTPQTVNAYYDPNLNQINFPAGILQAPFFAEDVQDSNNYGAIGMVIGHEITHGFDTSGSQFDGHGAQSDWWTPQVKTLFNKKAQCLKDQYSAYSPLPGLKINGNLTITENIADQGGLKLAFAAFEMSAAGKPQEPAVAGLNQEQQFFVSMAQMWCQKQTDEYLKKQVSGNPHSPAEFRVIGTVVNSPEFAQAFSCKQGQPMAPVNRCSIW